MKHIIKASLKHLKEKELANDMDFKSVIIKFINDLNISPKGTIFNATGNAVGVIFLKHIESFNFEQIIRATKKFPFSKGYHGGFPTRAGSSKYDLVFFGREDDDINSTAKELTEYFKTNSH